MVQASATSEVTGVYTASPGGDWNTISYSRIVNYNNCWERSGSITLPGATQIRLVIGNYNIEDVDFLLVAGVDELRGTGSITTTSVGGNTVELYLDSDATTPGSFEITAIEYQGEVTGNPVESGHLFDGKQSGSGDDCATICTPTSCGGESCYQVDDKLVVEGLAKASNAEVELVAERRLAPVPLFASKLFRIEPSGIYDEPVTLQVPVDPGVDVDTIGIWYMSEAAESAGWYLGENVEGWMVPGSMRAVEEDGAVYLEFQVNFSGVFQLAETQDIALGAVPLIEIDLRGSTGISIALGALGISLTLGLVLRRKRKICNQ
jgi:hypothetical protein